MSDKEIYSVPLSYDSAINRGMRDKVYGGLEELLKLLTLSQEDFEQFGTDAFAFTASGNDRVPIFQHPIISKEGKVFVDARPFISSTGNIKNKNDYVFLRRRAIIELFWAKNSDEFGGQEGFIADVFGSWFSNGIGSSLNLPMQVSQELRILATIYYMALVQRDQGYKDSEDLIFMLLKVLPRMMRIPAQPIDDFFVGKEEAIFNLYKRTAVTKDAPLENLILAIGETIDDNYGVNKSSIYAALTRGAFVAANAPELVATAMELPPLFALMMDYSLTKGIYGKTTIGRVTLSLSRKHNVRRFEEFVKTIYEG